MNNYLKALQKRYEAELDDPCDTYMEECYECPYEELCAYWITKEEK